MPKRGPGNRKTAKQAREEAKRLEILDTYADLEDKAKALLTDKDAQYYSLNNVSVNYHNTGLFDLDPWQGYIMFPEPISKEKQLDMQIELTRLISQNNLSIKGLVKYVTKKKTDDYWALLFWKAPIFINEMKRIGTFTNKKIVSKGDREKIMEDIVQFADRFKVHMARDLVQYVLCERPYVFQIMLFIESAKITNRIDKLRGKEDAITYMMDKQSFKLAKFSDAKKYCW